MRASALTPSPTPARLLRLPEVEQRTGFRKSKLYELISAGVLQPVKIGRTTAFVEAEVDAWVRARIAERGVSAPERLLLTEAEVAQALGVSVSWLQKDRLAALPRVPHIKLGTAVRYDLDEVRAALKASGKSHARADEVAA